MARRSVLYPVVVSATLALIAGALAAPASASPALHSVTATITVGTNPTAVEPCNGELYVANHSDSTISVIDPVTNTVVGLPIAVDTNPYGIACDNNLLYTANYGAGTVSVIDTATHAVVAMSIPAGSGASDVVVSNGYAYVSNQSVGTVSVIDTTTRANVGTLNVGGYPCGLAALSGKVYVSNLATGAATTVIDAATRSIDSTFVLPNAVRAMDAAAGYLYFPTEGASYFIKVDASNTSSRTVMSLPVAGTTVTVSGGTAYVTSFGGDRVYVIDVASMSITDTISMSQYPAGITTYGSSGYATMQGSGTVKAFSIIPPAPTAPGAPTSVVATAGNSQAAVSFTAPSSNGGSAITGYEVTASPGGVIATGASSPIIVNGLTNDTAYTFSVKAINAIGSSAASAASTAVTPTGPAPSSGGTSGGSSAPAPEAAPAPSVSDAPASDAQTGSDSSDSPAATSAATRVNSLPPAPAAFRVIKGRSGMRSTVQVLLKSDSAGTLVRSTVVVVLDRDGKVVSRISVSVKEGDSDVDVQVPYLAEGYSVHVYNVNELGVSPGAIFGASITHRSTIASRQGKGQPTLLGTLMPRPVRFGAGSSTLDSADRAQLRAIARVAKQKGKPLYVTGFANKGDGASVRSSSLATMRARAVADYLVRNGVRVWTRYWGVDTGSSRASDRRVEVRTSA